MVKGGADGDLCYDNVHKLFTQTMDLSPSLCPFQDRDCSFAQTKKGTVRGKFLVLAFCCYNGEETLQANGQGK